MSEAEFESYLQLLGRFLHLSQVQRDAIASELRDHMEQRLEELLAQGMDRRKAIDQALEEFGDAAALSGEFRRIAQHKHRRRIMQTTFGAVAASAAVILVASYLLPENRTGAPSFPESMAQNIETGVTAPDQVDAATDPTLIAQLNKRISVNFNVAPLETVVEKLRQIFEVNIQVEWAALEQAGVDMDHPVALQLKEVSGKNVLLLLMRHLSASTVEPLGYTTLDNVLVISTENALTTLTREAQTVVRVYDCRDLIRWPGGATDQVSRAPSGAGGPGMMEMSGGMGSMGGNMMMPGGMRGGQPGAGRPQAGRGRIGRALPQVTRFSTQTGESSELLASKLIELIVMTNGEPGDWALLGGDEGSIHEFDGMLVIQHRQDVHDRIVVLLDTLRQAIHEADKQSAVTDSTSRPAPLILPTEVSGTERPVLIIKKRAGRSVQPTPASPSSAEPRDPTTKP